MKKKKKTLVPHSSSLGTSDIFLFLYIAAGPYSRKCMDKKKKIGMDSSQLMPFLAMVKTFLRLWNINIEQNDFKHMFVIYYLVNVCKSWMKQYQGEGSCIHSSVDFGCDVYQSMTTALSNIIQSNNYFLPMITKVLQQGFIYLSGIITQTDIRSTLIRIFISRNYN